MMMNRRGFLIGAGAALAAPAIVSYANIMPVRNRLWTTAHWNVHMPIGDEVVFSCYMKAGDGSDLALSQCLMTGKYNATGVVWEQLSAVGRGWYRYACKFKSDDMDMLKVTLPHKTIYQAQLEYKSGGPAKGLEIQFAEGGTLLMPGGPADDPG